MSEEAKDKSTGKPVHRKKKGKKSETGNERRQKLKKEETDFKEEFQDITTNAVEKQSKKRKTNKKEKLSVSKENGLPTTLKQEDAVYSNSRGSKYAEKDNSPGHQFVGDWRADPFCPTMPSQQNDPPLVFHSDLHQHLQHLLPTTQLALRSQREDKTVTEEDIFGDLNLLKPGQPIEETWNNQISDEEPRRLEVLKNLTGLWSSSGQHHAQSSSRANHLSPALAQYLNSTATPVTSDLQKLGLTSDLMVFLEVPEQKLSIELWDLGENRGDQRFTAKWEITEDTNVLDKGTWLQNDDNW